MSYFCYDKLFATMKKKGVLRKDLASAGISDSTVTAMKRCQPISTKTICRLCDILNCKPNQIMEFIKEED